MKGNQQTTASCGLYDAHNHLQDERLASLLDSLPATLEQQNIRKMVVNGSCEEDWPAVHALAQKFPNEVIPSFGYHPWHVKERSANWQQTLLTFLNETPSAVGEIGLDRWIKDYNIEDQEQVFIWQLRLAAERNLPVSIHCLEAWGKLFDLLRVESRPHCGFLLHSYGGPKEMIKPLTELGAYFSLPGYFAHERKSRQREVFRHVPIERLLIETDAPDQSLPPELVRYECNDPKSGKLVNHPANLAAVYEFAAELVSLPLDQFVPRVEANFRELFGVLLNAKN